MHALKDQACIVGVGETTFTRGANKSELALMLEASMNAIADAGLTPHDIDGIIPPPTPSATAEHFAANLGIEDLRYAATVHHETSKRAAQVAFSLFVAKAAHARARVPFPTKWNKHVFGDAKGDC